MLLLHLRMYVSIQSKTSKISQKLNESLLQCQRLCDVRNKRPLRSLRRRLHERKRLFSSLRAKTSFLICLKWHSSGNFVHHRKRVVLPRHCNSTVMTMKSQTTTDLSKITKCNFHILFAFTGFSWPRQLFPKETAITPKLSTSDPQVVKPKCV